VKKKKLSLKEGKEKSEKGGEETKRVGGGVQHVIFGRNKLVTLAGGGERLKS